MKITKILAAASAVIMMLSCPVNVSAETARDIVARAEFELPEADASQSGLKVIEGKAYKYNSKGIPSVYTGKIKTTKGTKYYIGGSQWFGWMKISGSWYYFDPSDAGFMATSKAKTSLGTYYFSDTGAWNGKYSAYAKAPKDFSICLDMRTDDMHFNFDTEDRLIIDYFSLRNMSLYKKKLNISSMDRQILYDMFMSCKMDKIDTVLDSECLSDEGSDSTADMTFRIDVYADRNDIVITGDSTMYDHYEKNSQVQSAAYYIAFIDNYTKTLPAYKTIMKNYGE